MTNILNPTTETKKTAQPAKIDVGGADWGDDDEIDIETDNIVGEETNTEQDHH